MSLDWTKIEAIEQGGERVKKDQMDEIIDNIKKVENNLQLGQLPVGSKYSWKSGYSKFTLEEVKLENIEELRKAVDNLEDNNYCRAHRQTHYKVHYESNLTSQRTNHYSSYQSSHHGTYCSHRTGN